MIVADVNLVVYLFVPGPSNALARRWAEYDPEWVVPPLWRYEFTSAMVSYLRAGEVTLDQATTAVRDAAILLAKHEHEVDQVVVLNTALQLRISPYDSNYIVLADQLGVRCVTNDTQLLERARKQTRSLGSIRHE